MFYNNTLQHTMLGVLVNRALSISDIIVTLDNEGYVPNKRKYEILQWSLLLIRAYKSISSFDNETQVKLDNIYNKVLKL